MNYCRVNVSFCCFLKSYELCTNLVKLQESKGNESPSLIQFYFFMAPSTLWPFFMRISKCLLKSKFFFLEIAINIPFPWCVLCSPLPPFFFLSYPSSVIFVFPFIAENKCRKNNSWYDFDWGCAEVLLFTEYSETHEAWQSTHVTLLPVFEILPKKSDWNWPVVLIFLIARNRFESLEHFNILFSFLQVDSKWSLTNFKREGGLKSSQLLVSYQSMQNTTERARPIISPRRLDLLCRKEYS